MDESVYDAAREAEDAQRQLGVKRAKDQLNGPDPAYDAQGNPRCVECNALITEKRAALGFGRCISCQEYLEERGEA